MFPGHIKCVMNWMTAQVEGSLKLRVSEFTFLPLFIPCSVSTHLLSLGTLSSTSREYTGAQKQLILPCVQFSGEVRKVSIEFKGTLLMLNRSAYLMS